MPLSSQVLAMIVAAYIAVDIAVDRHNQPSSLSFIRWYGESVWYYTFTTIDLTAGAHERVLL